MSSLGIVGELCESKQFEWKIANFFSFASGNSYSLQRGSFYDSPSFVFENTSCHLRIYPAGILEDQSGFLSVYVRNESNCPFRVSNSLHIKKIDGTLVGGGTEFVNICSSRGYRNFYQLSVLEENKSDLVPSGILTIVCILKPNQGEKHDIINTKTGGVDEEMREILEPQQLAEVDLLSQNFKDLLSNKDCCDTVLFVQGKEFKVHKCVLMVRSSVFAAMFSHDTTEKATGEVNISDCDPDTFSEFLEYVYCGKLEIVSSNQALHLYKTSDKYNVQELKAFCNKYLTKNITVHNIYDIVLLADQYDETMLLSAVQNFFNKNLKEILISSDWENLFKKNFRLANKLLFEMSNAKQ